MNVEIERANQDFWNELCGTALARSLGITDHSRASLELFDRAYLDFYPYLLDYLRPAQLRGKRVLEIGLGYGTVGQLIAESGADYHGMDLAWAPVKMMRHRLRLQGLPGAAYQGSALQMPFASNSFDQVISIGCFHHTGDTARCVDESFRVLRPGGHALVMLYSRYSYRQWARWPAQTIAAWLREAGLRNGNPNATREQRRAYDPNQQGDAAPITDFFSVRQVKSMFRDFRMVQLRRENCEALNLWRIRLFKRETLLPVVGRSFGLDLYIQAEK